MSLDVDPDSKIWEEGHAEIEAFDWDKKENSVEYTAKDVEMTGNVDESSSDFCDDGGPEADTNVYPSEEHYKKEASPVGTSHLGGSEGIANLGSGTKEPEKLEQGPIPGTMITIPIHADKVNKDPNLGHLGQEKERSASAGCPGKDEVHPGQEREIGVPVERYDEDEACHTMGDKGDGYGHVSNSRDPDKSNYVGVNVASIGDTITTVVARDHAIPTEETTDAWAAQHAIEGPDSDQEGTVANEAPDEAGIIPVNVKADRKSKKMKKRKSEEQGDKTQGLDEGSSAKPKRKRQKGSHPVSARELAMLES
ncbi:hypothetical protein K470DRAFT_296410 [Piedraia hortae CBS 480.64]|uniref:Uncharacterized protein n=1 Tax=Piedraia hortae CBS 480.64 TaxID=1314780 RepID=A0A6A7BTL0_9PEZI|nr:hypothetical protein K470DRAFT_296410 [Piedraia hortae CBS 480.64]